MLGRKLKKKSIYSKKTEGQWLKLMQKDNKHDENEANLYEQAINGPESFISRVHNGRETLSEFQTKTQQSQRQLQELQQELMWTA